MHEYVAGSLTRCYRSWVRSRNLKYTDDARPEFSRIINLRDLTKDEMQLNLSGTAIECAALAKRFEISAITSLSANGNLIRLGSSRVRLRVTLKAEVNQTCVITLDPVVKRIEEHLDIQFEYERIDTSVPNIAFDPGLDFELLVNMAVRLLFLNLFQVNHLLSFQVFSKHLL